MLRALGLVGALLALVIVGMLAKKQLGSGIAVAPAVPAGAQAPASAQNPRQVQEQFEQSLDAAMQQPRAMPDDAK